MFRPPIWCPHQNGDWNVVIKISFWLSYTHARKQPFNGLLSGTTRVSRYQKKRSPIHTHSDRRTSFINFLHLLRSIASSLFSLRAWQSFSTTSLQVLFGLQPSISYSMHFFTQSSSSFQNTCPYYRSLFGCNTNVMSSIPNLPFYEHINKLLLQLKTNLDAFKVSTCNLSSTSDWRPKCCHKN